MSLPLAGRRRAGRRCAVHWVSTRQCRPRARASQHVCGDLGSTCGRRRPRGPGRSRPSRPERMGRRRRCSRTWWGVRGGRRWRGCSCGLVGQVELLVRRPALVAGWRGWVMVCRTGPTCRAIRSSSLSRRYGVAVRPSQRRAGICLTACSNAAAGTWWHSSAMTRPYPAVSVGDIVAARQGLQGDHVDDRRRSSTGRRRAGRA